MTNMPKYAVVTGGTRGIGYAIANLLLKNGYDVLLGGQNQLRLDKAMLALSKIYPDRKVHGCVGNFLIPDEITNFSKASLALFPKIDVLVNNAGIFEADSSQPNNFLDLAKRLMEINNWSVVALTETLLPQFIAQQSGHIINIESIASTNVLPNSVAYCISKHALHAYTKGLRSQLAAHQIKVTAILPGATYTDSWAGTDVNPNRFMHPNDIALAVMGCLNMSAMACPETIVLRPQLGDL
ncbi:MAG: SDR family oxidoreductase [Sphingobacteriales bacterium]|jgi:short-subunit dehydrogenase|nr:SDR family oxidoreductase [Sphingobacteriales bacterium]MBP9142289.1 SDR family oxidoreductase [Chitinophagales bacterium]MDA0198573.1 SDR family NAD(P)-dependent oxidoreductase [Bacteroidota bacterium]MBK6889238.1 SDR family oxidoreductase [Sphingobacteriales bacterium]MBK7528256.1 SDR family oxidoreductase [Sphingobacteriales bacterium]